MPAYSGHTGKETVKWVLLSQVEVKLLVAVFHINYLTQLYMVFFFRLPESEHLRITITVS